MTPIARDQLIVDCARTERLVEALAKMTRRTKKSVRASLERLAAAIPNGDFDVPRADIALLRILLEGFKEALGLWECRAKEDPE